MNLLGGARRAFRISGFQDSVRVCMEHCVCGKAVVTLKGGGFTRCHMDHPTCGRQSPFKCRHGPYAPLPPSKFQNVQFAHIT